MLAIGLFAFAAKKSEVLTEEEFVAQKAKLLS